MQRLLFWTLSIWAVVAGQAGLAQPTFREMVCDKVISDNIKITAGDRDLALLWRSRGGAAEVSLLRALAVPQIPTSLLRAYGDLHIGVTIPTSSCDFSTTNVGDFSCQFATDHRSDLVNVTVMARLSPYGSEPYDVYEGTLDKFSVHTEFSGTRNGQQYLTFPMVLGVETPSRTSVNAESDFFFAHYWESEGYRQSPSCTIDGQFLVR